VASVEQVDAQTAYSMLEGVIAALGIGVEMLEASPEKVVFKPGRCPVYEAARTLAVDHEASEANCRSSAIPMMDAMVKQLNPRLSYRLRTFRSGDGASCVEEIAAE
jgi:hypothetical protein